MVGWGIHNCPACQIEQVDQGRKSGVLIPSAETHREVLPTLQGPVPKLKAERGLLLSPTEIIIQCYALPQLANLSCVRTARFAVRVAEPKLSVCGACWGPNTVLAITQPDPLLLEKDCVSIYLCTPQDFMRWQVAHSQEVLAAPDLRALFCTQVLKPANGKAGLHDNYESKADIRWFGLNLCCQHPS